MTVLTYGTYDTPHVGHATFLRRCERFGEVVVAIRSDEMVRKLRGHDPAFTFNERASLIRALGYEVRESTALGRELIEEVRPDVLAIASDWIGLDWCERFGVDRDFLVERQIAVVYIPYTPGISTTELKRRLT